MDLFNNPMVNNAIKSLSKEELEKYKKVGEQMYSNMNNFTDSKNIRNNLTSSMEEAVAYVEEGLKSGLLPSDLTEDEVILLVETYGEKWYEKYGYTKEEVPEPGLSINVKQDIEAALKSKIKTATLQSKMKAATLRSKNK